MKTPENLLSSIFDTLHEIFQFSAQAGGLVACVFFYYLSVAAIFAVVLITVIRFGKACFPPDSKLSVNGAYGIAQYNPAMSQLWKHGNTGTLLAMKETSLSRCIPNVTARWEIQDLITDLIRTDARGGSDLLDYRVRKIMGIDDELLKPTQSVEDAKRLLSYRYMGLKSKYEWDVHRSNHDEAAGNDCFVTLALREPSKRVTQDSPWLAVTSQLGKSEALAITIAALTRETWIFTS